jgi:hypothetical protein
MYEAIVERDGAHWFIRVPDIGATQARTLREVEPMTEDLIVTMTGRKKRPAVEYHIELPAPVRRHLDRSRKLRDRAADAQQEAAEELRTAARELAESYGLSLRDIGRALGVSHQRAHQLVQQ